PVSSFRPASSSKSREGGRYRIPPRTNGRLHAIRHIFLSSEKPRATLTAMSWWKRTKPVDDGVNANMPLIRLEGISKVFKGDADEEPWALSDITLDIGRGEYISVSGPSGCGKSTFLSLLAM